MTSADYAKYQYLLSQGFPKDRLDELVRETEPQPVKRTVDRRILDSALRLDVLDAQIEQARLERHAETRAALERLGFDVSDFRPAPGPYARESHLARAFELASATTDPLRPGLIRRPNTGVVLGVR